MEELKLSDAEQRYFSDLYLCCDTDSSGKVTLQKAKELFQSSNLSVDALSKVLDFVLQNVSYSSSSDILLSRKQFYTICKLIAACQANIPLRRETLAISSDLPLPRFTWPATSLETPTTTVTTSMSTSLFGRKGSANSEMCTKNVDFTSTDSEVESQPEVNNGGGDHMLRLRHSPDASSTASDSPTPTNSIQEQRNWADAWKWKDGPCEERRQLLATEEESSDGEVYNEVWNINSEQSEYYMKQFLSLQRDIHGVIPGHLARPFFEKSRLPVNELRRIWQLSDVTRDGALNQYEFSIAMHLVVLRRNNIPLPDTLPASLQKLAVMSVLFYERQQQIATSPPKTTTATPPPPPPEVVPPTVPSQTKDVPVTREWTKFVDSPTSSISSPGPKPVNFDFHKSAVETDPKILHPVALRVTPEISANNDDEPAIRRSPRTSLTDNEIIRPIQRPQPKVKNTPGPGALPPPPIDSSTGPMSLPLAPPRKEAPPPPPPRPPLRTHTRSSSLDLNRLGRIPPAVPPRASPSPGSPIKRLINQRSEGDITPMNNAVIQNVDQEGVAFANFDHFTAAGEVPQQPVAETYENVLQSSGIFPGEQLEAERRRLFAQFTRVSTENSAPAEKSNEMAGGPRKHGAFEVYRKPAVSETTTFSTSSVGVNKKEMFRRLQEQNATLLRICQELSQELADVKEERIALTIRLEQQQQQTGSG